MTQREEDRSFRKRNWSGRGIRSALWGGGIAVAATAMMIAITLPRDAAGDDTSRTGASATTSAAPGQTTGGNGSGAEGTEGTADTAVQENDAPQGEQQSGRGPLTESEVDRARQLAVGQDLSLRRDARTVDGDRGPEYLDTDLAEPADGVPAAADAARVVEVLFYDYSQDELVKKTVDLGTGKVVRTDAASGLQPPPSADESTEAAELLIAGSLGKGLRTDFKAATDGTTLTKASQLSVSGIAYNTAEQHGPAELSKCGKHRCVRLFTQVKGGPWIDTTNLVVDLSDRTVGRIN